MLGAAAQQLSGGPGRGVELDALQAVAFGDLFHPHEHPGPGALRAGVAAPDAPGQHGDEEQAERGDDQDRREQDEILRPEGGAEDVELLPVQVPQHRLAPVPVQPDGAEIEQHQQGAAQQAQVAETSAETARVDGPAALGGRQADRLLGSTVSMIRAGMRSVIGFRPIGSSGEADDPRRGPCITDSDVTAKYGSDGARQRCRNAGTARR